MPDLTEAEPKSERLGLAVSVSEMRALEFIKDTHGDRYEGISSVLRDYSITDALAFYRRAAASLKVS